MKRGIFGMMYAALAGLFFASAPAHGQDAKTPYQQGIDANKAARYDEAIADFNQAIEADPKNATAFVLRGFASFMKGDYDTTIADCSQAIQIDPTLVRAYIRRGYAYRRKGDYDAAVADFTQAFQIAPANVQAHKELGATYAWKGDYARAVAAYDDALAANPKAIPIYNNLAWLLATCPQAEFRNGKKAVEAATKACDLSLWNRPDTVDTLAAAYAEAGDFDHAVLWENEAINNPNMYSGGVADFKTRLALYEAHQPYHVDHFGLADPVSSEVGN